MLTVKDSYYHTNIMTKNTMFTNIRKCYILGFSMIMVVITLWHVNSNMGASTIYKIVCQYFIHILFNTIMLFKTITKSNNLLSSAYRTLRLSCVFMDTTCSVDYSFIKCGPCSTMPPYLYFSYARISHLLNWTTYMFQQI